MTNGKESNLKERIAKMGMKKKVVMGAVGVAALAGLGVGAASATTLVPAPAAFGSVQSTADTPTPGDTADVPDVTDSPTPGDTADVPGATEVPDPGEKAGKVEGDATE